jgi:hypothetical protein
MKKGIDILSRINGMLYGANEIGPEDVIRHIADQKNKSDLPQSSQYFCVFPVGDFVSPQI